jgi:hypothetical protein
VIVLKLLLSDDQGFVCGLAYQGGWLTIGLPAKWVEQGHVVADHFDVIVSFEVKGWRAKARVFVGWDKWQDGLARVEARFAVKRVKGFRRLMR